VRPKTLRTGVNRFARLSYNTLEKVPQMMRHKSTLTQTPPLVSFKEKQKAQFPTLFASNSQDASRSLNLWNL